MREGFSGSQACYFSPPRRLQFQDKSTSRFPFHFFFPFGLGFFFPSSQCTISPWRPKFSDSKSLEPRGPGREEKKIYIVASGTQHAIKTNSLDKKENIIWGPPQALVPVAALRETFRPSLLSAAGDARGK